MLWLGKTRDAANLERRYRKLSTSERMHCSRLWLGAATWLLEIRRWSCYLQQLDVKSKSATARRCSAAGLAWTDSSARGRVAAVQLGAEG